MSRKKPARWPIYWTGMKMSLSRQRVWKRFGWITRASPSLIKESITWRKHQNTAHSGGLTKTKGVSALFRMRKYCSIMLWKHIVTYTRFKTRNDNNKQTSRKKTPNTEVLIYCILVVWASELFCYSLFTFISVWGWETSGKLLWRHTSDWYMVYDDAPSTRQPFHSSLWQEARFFCLFCLFGFNL